MIDQLLERELESPGLHQEEEEEEKLPELVHDENGYTIPETVVKRLRQQGEDPTKWSQLTQPMAPSNEEIILSSSTIKEDSKEEQDQMLSEDDEMNPYAKVDLKGYTTSMSRDSLAEEAELVNIDSPAAPLQPFPISEIKDEDNPPSYQYTFMDDPSIPHVKPNHPEQPSTDKDENPSATKKVPVKLQVSTEIASIMPCVHAKKVLAKKKCYQHSPI